MRIPHQICVKQRRKSTVSKFLKRRLVKCIRRWPIEEGNEIPAVKYCGYSD
jgi:hypothetical protein